MTTVADDPTDARFTLHPEVRECPRCEAPTWGHAECASCGLTLDDRTLESYRARAVAARQWQSLALGALVIAVVCTVAGAAAGYALGARGSDVAARNATRTSAQETATVFRALPRQARFQLHATQLQFLFAPEVLEPAAIRFSPVAVPNQPKPAGTDDLTFVARSDSGWRQLTPDERQLLLVALVRKHQAFLGLAGAADSARCAVVMATRLPDGSERILAIRDRRGQIYVN
ncbi:MAG: hypothetical protein H3C62_00405 [Gemmatimonadaceae bacterium]|nr:hypothetical protein [Gemmatimonadaceae bacterium]